jgi:hypothetical protein
MPVIRQKRFPRRRAAAPTPVAEQPLMLPLLPGESHEEYTQLVEAHVKNLKPEGEFELSLVHLIANEDWKAQRYTRSTNLFELRLFELMQAGNHKSSEYDWLVRIIDYLDGRSMDHFVHAADIHHQMVRSRSHPIPTC